MIETQYLYFLIALFSFLAVLTAWLLMVHKYRQLELKNVKLEALFIEKEKNLLLAEQSKASLSEENVRLNSENTRIKSDIENQKKYMDDKIAYMQKSQEELTVKFRDISSEIIKAQNRQFNDEQKNAMTSLLKPFQDQISEFKRKVEMAHEENIKNKSSFDEQLKNLFSLNQNLSKDAQDLSAALKGNKKLQGNWGEFQLERVLEVSGLQKGLNYVTQETLKDEANHMLRPDVIIKLPYGRNVIIDSKVSLNDYLSFINCEREDERSEYLKKHVMCLKNHIDELSGKEYQKLLKSNSLDYVVIFIPIESAYVEAVRYDNTLYDYAYKKNIAMTTPSSLLPILRTIENLWRIENQNKNVAQIADVGGSLYDKISNFIEDMQKIDKALDGARKNYDTAISKLATGKGNALSLAARLKDYGAKTSKSLAIEFEDHEVATFPDEVAND